MRQNNLAKGIINQANKDGLAKIVKLLRQQLGQILPCLALLESGKLMKGVRMSVCTEEEMEEAPWPATYIRLSKLPKYWIVAFLKNRFARLSAEQADMISEKHGALMMEVFWYATGTGVALSFPRGTHDKRVCSQGFAARCVEVGERLRKLEDHLAKCLAGKHKFDWQEHGIYRLEKPDKGDRVAHILHCSGAKASRVITCWGGGGGVKTQGRG